MKTLIAIAAAAAATVAATAGAEPRAPRPVTEAAAQDGVPAPAANPRQRICFVQEVTGSRIPVRACETRAHWQAIGQPSVFALELTLRRPPNGPPCGTGGRRRAYSALS
ncbi:hypothetical protein AB5I41_13895 [Sphingomonas sp. MMS24-JH45]